MFCQRCGNQLQAEFQVCPQCGRHVGDVVRGVAQSRLEQHLRLLGIFWMASSGLFLIPAVILMVLGGSAHLVIPNQPFGAALTPLLYVIGGGLLIFAGFGICVGLGLLQHRSWARVAAMVLAVLALFHAPLGTALGVYTLWVLLADEHGEEYQYLGRSTA